MNTEQQDALERTRRIYQCIADMCMRIKEETAKPDFLRLFGVGDSFAVTAITFTKVVTIGSLFWFISGIYTVASNKVDTSKDYTSDVKRRGLWEIIRMELAALLSNDESSCSLRDLVAPEKDFEEVTKKVEQEAPTNTEPSTCMDKRFSILLQSNIINSN